jgi:hypothetical protein
MTEERQDSLREEERRMRQGPYPIGGSEPYFGAHDDFTRTRLLVAVVVVLVLIGAALSLVGFVR